MGFNSAFKGLNKKQNVELDSAASSGDQASPEIRLRLHYQFLP